MGARGIDKVIVHDQCTAVSQDLSCFLLSLIILHRVLRKPRLVPDFGLMLSTFTLMSRAYGGFFGINLQTIQIIPGFKSPLSYRPRENAPDSDVD